MSAVLDSLIPIFLLILLGHVLLRTGLVPAEGWIGLERLLYYAAFPALIVQSIGRAGASGGEGLALAATLISAQSVVTLAIVALRPVALARLDTTRPGFTSLVQGVVRWNTMVALGLIGGLHGSAAVSVAGYGLAVMIPFANLVSVTALAIDGDHGSEAGRGGLGRLLLKQLATNPLVIAVALGLLLSWSPVKLPRSADSALTLLGQASIATGFLVVGAGLDVAAIRPSPAVLLTVALKLVAMPALMLGFGLVYGLDGTTLSIAMICGAVPTASAAFVLARRMGGDAPLMARIVATQSVAAVATVPLALWIGAWFAGPG